MRALLAGIGANQPVLIAGPTASGKSGFALALAEAQGGVVINADALQVYGCWRVLTARPTVAEEAQVAHRLYGHVGRDEAYSVGHWLREVRAILATGVRPIIVGGTGLYFSALTQGLVEMPLIPAPVRAQADARRLSGDLAGMIADLDSDTRGRIDLANPARVQRAYEVQQATGRGLAAWQAQTPAPLLAIAGCRALVLRPERDWLGARIDLRFGQMMAAGALQEARAMAAGFAENRPADRAIGARELVAHLRGEMTLEAAVAAAQLASRQYAKRQRTWFRNRMADWQGVALPLMLA